MHRHSIAKHSLGPYAFSESTVGIRVIGHCVMQLASQQMQEIVPCERRFGVVYPRNAH